MQWILPKVEGVLTVITVPVLVTVPLWVPSIQWISRVPFSSTLTSDSPHLAKTKAVLFPVTVVVALPAAVTSASIVDSSHLISGLSDSCVVSVAAVPAERTAWILSPLPTAHPEGHVVPVGEPLGIAMQRTVAEAVLPLANAIRAAAATAARPNILTYFMCFLLASHTYVQVL